MKEMMKKKWIEEQEDCQQQLTALCGQNGFWTLIFRMDGETFATTPQNLAQPCAQADLAALTEALGEGEEIALIFANPPYCTMAAQRGESLLPSLDDTAQIIGSAVESVSPDFAEILQALNGASACFVRGKDGDEPFVIVCGRNAYEATVALQVLEKAAEVELKAAVIGGAVPLSRDEGEKMRRNYLESYSKAERQARSDERRA